jgi:hypothetical protein
MLYIYIVILKQEIMITIIEASEIINKEFAGCYASVEGRKITVTYRGKKSDKVIIYNGEVSYEGGFSVAQVAGKIAERLGLVKVF